uniref:Saposin B-type domain-containing protein n=1 Tax=Rhabditophanes sp. KR3021 TaxID=114890 RepID=A0AC35U816_9BILA
MSTKCIACFLILVLANVYLINAAQSQTCQMCNYIIGIAEQHFKQNEPESDLLTLLTQGCYYLGGVVSGSIIGPCLNLVNGHIDTLYSDFQSGMTAWDLCNQQKLCTSADTNSTLLA